MDSLSLKLVESERLAEIEVLNDRLALSLRLADSERLSLKLVLSDAD